MSEDIVPILDKTEVFELVPGYPRVCLWPDSVEMLLGSKDGLPLLTPAWEKRYLPLDGARGKFVPGNLPLGLIYLFGTRSTSGDAPYAEALHPREALLELVQNTYMNWLPDKEQRALEFELLARVLKTVPVRRIVPSLDATRIEALCGVITRDAEAILAKHSPAEHRISERAAPTVSAKVSEHPA